MSSRVVRPPRLAVFVLGRVLPARERDTVLGDLTEEHASLGAGPVWSWLWFWLQVLWSLPWAVRLRVSAGSAAAAPKRQKERGMRTLMKDLRYALRSLRKNGALALTVLATVSLGIGATAVVFSVVDGMVLHPFPFPEPDRLVTLGTVYPKLGGELQFWENLSPAEYLDIREQSRTLERVVAWDMGNRQVMVGESTENLFSAFWWGDAFPTLGVAPELGRGFTQEEIRRGERVAVLSHRAWVTRFGADRDLVGGRILVNGEPYTLVGVMPPGTLIYGTDLWIPMPVGPEAYPRQRRQFQVMARMAPGVTMPQVQSEMETIARRTEAEYGAAMKEYAGWRIVPATWTAANVRTFRTAALVLLGAVAFVLLLVCANIASLLLSRGASRRREVAVRTALGASRPRILRQFLTESVVLGLGGGVAGIGLAVLGVRAVNGVLAAAALPIPGNVVLNGRVLAFTTAAAVVAGILVGLVPALHASKPDLRDVLSADARSTTASRSRLRLQRVFVTLEVALAVVLLMGGGLLVNSFLRMNAVDPGFRPDHMLTMRLTLAGERYSHDQVAPFFRELVERTAAIPGVSSAAVASQIPPRLFTRRPFAIEGAEPVEEGRLPTAFTTLVSPGYFSALGMSLLRGRVLTEHDGPDAPLAVVINDVAADRYFPGQDPIGRRLRTGGPNGPWFQVVGVVRATRNRGLDVPPEPELFASTSQLPGAWNQLFLVLRTQGDPRAVLPAVRQQVRQLDPQQPVYMVRTMKESYAAASLQRRVATVALSLFAGFALLLAAVGIYAVVAYGVGQRTREIGLRMALGAGHGQVLRLVVRQALVPVAIGVAAGSVGALALSRVLSGLLFHVSAEDPLTLAAVLLLFGSVGFLASYMPARRASKLDPVTALSSEQG
ncbi:MAG: ABC transporter permease [Gemmatimonadota bacterium]